MPRNLFIPSISSSLFYRNHERRCIVFQSEEEWKGNGKQQHYFSEILLFLYFPLKACPVHHHHFTFLSEWAETKESRSEDEGDEYTAMKETHMNGTNHQTTDLSEETDSRQNEQHSCSLPLSSNNKKEEERE